MQIFETQRAENQLLKVHAQALEWMEIVTVWILNERVKIKINIKCMTVMTTNNEDQLLLLY
jgi:hypothetical protein